MAQIELRLSNKIQKDTGRSEVMLRFFYTKHDFYAKTEVFINPEFFEYYVDRKKTINPKKPIPAYWNKSHRSTLQVWYVSFQSGNVLLHQQRVADISLHPFWISSTVAGHRNQQPFF